MMRRLYVLLQKIPFINGAKKWMVVTEISIASTKLHRTDGFPIPKLGDPGTPTPPSSNYFRYHIYVDISLNSRV